MTDLVPIRDNPEPRPTPLSGYYRVVSAWKEFEIGELAYMVPTSEGRCTLIQGTHTWSNVPIQTLLDHFAFDPDGLQQRQVEMAKLMDNLHTLDGQQDLLLSSAQNVPCLPAPQEMGAMSDGTALAAIEEQSPAKMEKQIKRVKTMAAKTKAMMVHRQKALMAHLKEQELILREKSEILAEYVSQANEAIYMINAYLGTDEEVVRIQEGERAPKSDKIHIRQLILYMDEESAAADRWADKGGMDFKTIEKFDAWVLKPKNLRQVLPESKGVVAIRPRRGSKKYSDDAYVNTRMNEANKELYILIRNGDLIYRIFSTLVLDDVLLPRENEYDDHFISQWSDRKPIRPGDADYMKAMKAAAKEQRRFYTVMLLLQGILDRTKIFQPLPAAAINVCAPWTCTEYLKIIRDAEPSRLLTDGRPSFNEWLAEINGHMDVGIRVMGNFHSYYYENSYGSKERVSPARASLPKDSEIYTIDAKKGDTYIFKYSRKGETVYGGWGDWRGHEAKNRASYKCFVKDKHILNLDFATIEDMEYYINSRLNRHNYESMLPLLVDAVKAKKEEIKAEKPFRSLLVGEIMKAEGVSHETANDQIDTLIHWWKFKNKTHRALTSDDSKALRMIVAEFSRRRAAAEDNAASIDLHEAFRDQICNTRKDVLAVFHRKEQEYAVFYYHNDENVFATEEHWIYSKRENQFKRLKTTELKTIDRRFESWNSLFLHDRWQKWKFNARADKHLTDHEKEECLQLALKAMKDSRDEEKKKGKEDLDEDEKCGKLVLLPLAVAQIKDVVSLWYIKRAASVPPKSKILTQKSTSPVCGRIDVKFERTQSGIKTNVSDPSTVSCSLLKAPKDDWLHRHYTAPFLGIKCVRRWEDNIQMAIEQEKQCRRHEKERNKLRRPIWNACRQVTDRLIELWYEDQHVDFLKDYEDDEEESFWNLFKEDLSAPSNFSVWYWFDDMLDPLLERNICFYGMTVEQIVEKGKKLGVVFNDRHVDEYNKAKNIVIQKVEEEEEEEDEDDEAEIVEPQEEIEEDDTGEDLDVEAEEVAEDIEEEMDDNDD